MILQEEVQKRDILKELIRDIHMPSFCDEEGRCEALDDCIGVDANECSCCDINRIVKAFNRGIEFQIQKLPWISVDDDLPCNHEDMYNMSGSLIYTEDVLVLVGNKPVIAYMIFNDNTGEWKWNKPLNIKYWMPIPKFKED